MSTVMLKNTNPLGYVDVPLIGRQGPAPYLVCHDPEACHDEHEHTQVVGMEEHGQPGSGCLIPGEVFEVSDKPIALLDEQGKQTGRFGPSIAEQLLAQVGNYELVADPLDGMKVAELKAYAAEHSIDIGDATTKADILAAIRKG